MLCKEFEEMAGAYALDAVTPEESKAAEEHLAQCFHCTRLLQEMRSVVALLPLSAPQVEPSAALRERIFSTIQNSAQVASTPTQQVPTVLAPQRRQLQTPWRRWTTGLIAAAAILMFALLGGMMAWNILLQQQVNGLAAKNVALQRQVQTLSYQLQGTANTSEVRGQLTYYTKENITVLVIHGLPQLQGQHVYQGWLLQGKQPMSVGLLNVQNGSGVVGFAGGVKGFDAAAVSLEPGPVASPNAPQGQVLAVGNLQHPVAG